VTYVCTYKKIYVLIQKPNRDQYPSDSGVRRSFIRTFPKYSDGGDYTL